MPALLGCSPIIEHSTIPAIVTGSAGHLPLKPVCASQLATTAIVYCEGNIAAGDGKTANGLVRHSEKYRILSVIDSEKSGLDSGTILDNKPNNIPICKDLADALSKAGKVPDYFILGMAPASGMLSIYERSLILEAMSHGMNIINGLHEFLNDDPVFIAASESSKVKILDIPENAYLKDEGNDWRCVRGYEKKAESCSLIIIPANAHLDSMGDGWICNEPYRESQGLCEADGG